MAVLPGCLAEQRRRPPLPIVQPEDDEVQGVDPRDELLHLLAIVVAAARGQEARDLGIVAVLVFPHVERARSVVWAQAALDGPAALAVVADMLHGDEAGESAGREQGGDLRVSRELPAAPRVGNLVGEVARELLVGPGGSITGVTQPGAPKDTRHGCEQAPEEGARIVPFGVGAVVEPRVVLSDVPDVFRYLRDVFEMVPFGHADALADEGGLVRDAFHFDPVYAAGWEHERPDGLLQLDC